MIRLRRRRLAVLALAAVAPGLAACDALFVEPASDAPAELSLAVSGAEGGLDRDVDRLVLHFERPTGEVRDTSVRFLRYGTGARTRVRLVPEELVDGLRIEATLLEGLVPLYCGATVLEAGSAGLTAATIEVAPIVGAVRISPTSVLLVAIGAAQPLTAQALFASGDPVAVPLTFSWTSSDPAIAAVGAAGVVVAVGNGTAVVTARHGDAEASVPVVVQQGAVTISPTRAGRWSPDGRWIAFVAGSGRRVGFIRPDRSALRWVDGHGLLEGVTWSPDGRWLLGVNNDYRVAVVSFETGQMIDLAWRAREPAWWR